MQNAAITDNFSLLAKLMDIHGDNPFKAKAYANAAFTVDKLEVQLSTIDKNNIANIKGIGNNTAKKIIEQLETGELDVLNEMIAKTPPGILQMLEIKGIGPKKIATIWKELEIETLGELLYACNENRLTLYKGFGEKTQANIKHGIEFYLSNIGSYLYAQVETYVITMEEKLRSTFPNYQFILTGEVKRQIETTDRVEWVTDVSADQIATLFNKLDYKETSTDAGQTIYIGPENIKLIFYSVPTTGLISKAFETSCSSDFFNAWKTHFTWGEKLYETEEQLFAEHQLNFIPAFLREKANTIEKAKQVGFADLIQTSDITAIIHSHSTWSDGVHSIEQMAKAAIEKGLQYLVISDHSKSAFYAKGLDEVRILAQHQQIDELNAQHAPFRIFKSIESDILNDGRLDYDDEVLSSFDIVIASIHSNLKMPEDRAMMRLINAIENPFTSILGHMTGRLLLSRNGYPVNHKTVIDACAANDVVIELNAHPSRLDIDWRWIDYALEKNVLISINPDAHSIDGFEAIKYGVITARKAAVKKQHNLSSFSIAAFEKFLVAQHAKRQ